MLTSVKVSVTDETKLEPIQLQSKMHLRLYLCRKNLQKFNAEQSVPTSRTVHVVEWIRARQLVLTSSYTDWMVRSSAEVGQ